MEHVRFEEFGTIQIFRCDDKSPGVSSLCCVDSLITSVLGIRCCLGDLVCWCTWQTRRSLPNVGLYHPASRALATTRICADRGFPGSARAGINAALGPLRVILRPIPHRLQSPTRSHTPSSHHITRADFHPTVRIIPPSCNTKWVVARAGLWPVVDYDAYYDASSPHTTQPWPAY